MTVVFDHYFGSSDPLVSHQAFLAVYAVVSVSFVVIYEHTEVEGAREFISSLFSRIRSQTPEYIELQERPRAVSLRGEEALVVSNVRHRYGNKIAVNDVSLVCRVGECLSLLGANGAGKSSLVKLCTRQILSDQGSILIANMAARKAGKFVGYCAQEDIFAEDLTVTENLEVMAEIKNVSRTQVQNLVDDLDLRAFKDRRSADLSGGNKRKLCVGMALIADPVVVFLDEPSSGMDPVARRFLWAMIKRSSVNAAVILTTHLMEEAEHLSDRMGVMKDGTIIAEGTIDEIRKLSPSGWEVKLRGTGFDDEAIAEIQSFLNSQLDAMVAYAAISLYDMTFFISSNISDISDLFKALEVVKSRHGLTDYSVSQLSLEAIVNQLVRDAFPLLR